MIYFDNAATSRFKPLGVKIALLKSLKKYSANPGRSGHSLSILSATEILKARIKLRTLFNLKTEDDIIFTHNCTAALNLAILGSVKNGGHVIASCLEHNSVLRPLHELQNKGLITLTIISPANKINITAEDVKNALKENTYMVCVCHVSNTLGNANDIYNIGKLCNENKLLYLCDAAQSAGHVDIDMQFNNINFLTFAGHKGLFAPASIGGLCLNTTTLPKPIVYGGTGTNSIELLQPTILPEKYESGTLAVTQILGLSAGVSYVINNFEKFAKKTAQLTQYLIEQLIVIPKIKLYTNRNSSYGVVMFNVSHLDSVELSTLLDQKYKIATRGGLHCAPLAHMFLGTTKNGALRVSLNHKNSKRQINKLIKIIKSII